MKSVIYQPEFKSYHYPSNTSNVYSMDVFANRFFSDEYIKTITMPSGDRILEEINERIIEMLPLTNSGHFNIGIQLSPQSYRNFCHAITKNSKYFHYVDIHLKTYWGYKININPNIDSVLVVAYFGRDDWKA